MSKIKIVNRDFSVLEGETKIKFSLESTIVYAVDGYLSIKIVRDSIDCLEVNVYLTANVPDQYIIDILALHGFDIEFIDAKEINTFEELKKFLQDNELSYYPVLGGSEFYIDDIFYDKDGVEKAYNVKFNLEV